MKGKIEEGARRHHHQQYCTCTLCPNLSARVTHNYRPTDKHKKMLSPYVTMGVKYAKKMYETTVKNTAL